MSPPSSSVRPPEGVTPAEATATAVGAEAGVEGGGQAEAEAAVEVGARAAAEGAEAVAAEGAVGAAGAVEAAAGVEVEAAVGAAAVAGAAEAVAAEGAAVAAEARARATSAPGDWRRPAMLRGPPSDRQLPQGAARSVRASRPFNGDRAALDTAFEGLPKPEACAARRGGFRRGGRTPARAGCRVGGEP
jgi:hypothetical protein